MRRVVRLGLVLALVAGVVGVPSATAYSTFGGCTTGQDDYLLYCHSGDHVPLSRLPLKFKVSTADPGGLSDGEISNAAGMAAFEWERHWPIPSAFGGCSTGMARAICINGTTTSNSFGKNGTNQIVWGNPEECGPNVSAAAIAVACLWYEGSSGDAAHRIAEVDVILNRDYVWRYPKAAYGIDVGDAVDEVTGEVRGAAPLSPCDRRLGECFYDLGSVLTHELGHALGLDDIGDTQGPFPGSLREAPKYQLTMYRWYVQQSTNKRTLDAGDIAGLQHVAWETFTSAFD